MKALLFKLILHIETPKHHSVSWVQDNKVDRSAVSISLHEEKVRIIWGRSALPLTEMISVIEAPGIAAKAHAMTLPRFPRSWDMQSRTFSLRIAQTKTISGYSIILKWKPHISHKLEIIFSTQNCPPHCSTSFSFPSRECLLATTSLDTLWKVAARAVCSEVLTEASIMSKNQHNVLPPSRMLQPACVLWFCRPGSKYAVWLILIPKFTDALRELVWKIKFSVYGIYAPFISRIGKKPKMFLRA